MASLDFYNQYSYQPSVRAEWNTSRNAKFSEKWSPTYSSVRNLLKDVLHQREVVKEEKARDAENKKSKTQKRTKGVPKMKAREEPSWAESRAASLGSRQSRD